MEEDRKREEREFHNALRDEALRENSKEFARLTENKKFYAVTRVSDRFVRSWLNRSCPGKQVLDYCCGNGTTSIQIAKAGGTVVGVDISDVSVQNAREAARREGVSGRARFIVGDAENLGFKDGSFDVIHVSGVLHHLNLPVALSEIARVLKPSGSVINLEALGHNPLFQWYRRATPHLRTAWEVDHIIRLEDLEAAKQQFGIVQWRYFHLATLLAVPFRGTPVFNPLLTILEGLDRVLLRIPGLRTQAWMVAFVLRNPKRPI